MIDRVGVGARVKTAKAIVVVLGGGVAGAGGLARSDDELPKRTQRGGAITLANQITRTIWVVLIVAQVMFLIVAFWVAGSRQGDAPSHIPIMAAALAFISFTTAIATVVIRRLRLVGPIQEGTLDPRSNAGMAAAFPHFMVVLMLSESVGIYGLVLTFLSGEFAYAVPFIAAAIALLFFHRPTAPALCPPVSSMDRSIDSTPIA